MPSSVSKKLVRVYSPVIICVADVLAKPMALYAAGHEVKQLPSPNTEKMVKPVPGC
jgi:hypothetical protein